MSGFGIYVHWPFCAAKCPYCDFNSHVRSEIDESGWVDAIARELGYVASLQEQPRPVVEAIFFGGGTPSLMRGKSVASTLETIAKLWPLDPNIEITLESNPASADATRFRDYNAAGVNRLSLGVQALNDCALKMLGRLHNVAEAKSAIRLALSTFERTSFDLIYARPDQGVADWQRRTPEQAFALGSEHLSLYQLSIEPATPFATLARTGALKIPGEDRAVELYRSHTGGKCTRWSSGLRNFQSCPPRRAVPAQSDLLALWRLWRWPRCAWPSGAERPTLGHRLRAFARTLARNGFAAGPQDLRQPLSAMTKAAREHVC